MTTTTLQYSIHINAPKEKVWEHLWSEAGYRTWTAAFCEGSYAESDWKEGSPIRFLSPGGNGMFGVIKTMVPFQVMSFEHQGEIKAGVEEKKDWSGALESYHLSETESGTQLDVHLDMSGEFESYFNTTFPKALATVKQMAEA